MTPGALWPLARFIGALSSFLDSLDARHDLQIRARLFAANDCLLSQPGAGHVDVYGGGERGGQVAIGRFLREGTRTECLRSGNS